MIRWLLALLVLIATMVGLTLGVLNPDPANLDLGFFQLTLSLGAMVALAVGVGLLAGMMISPLLLSGRHRRSQAPAPSAVDLVSDQDRS